MNYQHLGKYKGSMYGQPLYTGIEFSNEVPDNMVMSSPGGLASTYHHPTKGFYGDGSGSRWDFYAGEGLNYPYAEFGNLYQQGQSAAQHMGYYVPPPDTMYTQNESTSPPEFKGENAKKHREKFTTSKDIIPQTIVDDVIKDTIPSLSINYYALFFLVILAFIALYFWSLAGKKIIQDYIFKNKGGWRQWLATAIVFTILLAISIYNINGPIISMK
jgi:hypothetical protein